MVDSKLYTREVTKRFLQEVDRLVSRSSGTRVTLNQVAEKLGVLATNISRMRTREYFVTVEAACRLCAEFGTDPGWLFMGNELGIKPSSNIDQRLEKLEKAIFGDAKTVRSLPAVNSKPSASSTASSTSLKNTRKIRKNKK